MSWIVDTRECTSLSPEEQAEYERLVRAEEIRLLPEREVIRARVAAPKIKKLVERGVPETEARARIHNDLDMNFLRSDDVLHFERSGTVTVADVLKEPDRFLNERLSDPNEGPNYKSRFPAILRRREGDGGLWIDSFAHGRTRYELMGDDRAPSGEPTGDGPIPLLPDRYVAEPYPLKALGPILGPAAEAIAYRIQAPEAIAGQSVLAVASLAAQAHADVMLPYGQTRPLGLYLVTIGSSGERKSSTDAEAMAPVVEHEAMMNSSYESAVADYEIAKTAWTSARRSIDSGNNKLSLADRTMKLKLLGPCPPAPLLPTITSSEPTVEGLLKNGPRLHPSHGIFSPEGAQLICGYGFGPDHLEKTGGTLSSFWDGGATKRLRADEFLNYVGRRLSMHVMVQPGVAAKFVENEILRDQGMLSRLLVAHPDSKIGTRLWREPGPRGEEMAAYNRTIRRMLATEPTYKNERKTELRPRVLHLTYAARAKWIEFHDEVEPRLGKSRELSTIKDFGSKVAENAARIAGVLTLVSDLGATEVGPEAMDSALDLMEWYLDEALRLDQTASVDPQMVDAQKLLDWLMEHEHAYTEGVTRKEIAKSGPGRLRAKRKYDPLIAILLDHKWVTERNGRLFPNTAV
jgi:Protein of unknown function (DUF3987)